MIRVAENVPLAGLTTLGVGGPARFYVEAHSREELLEALAEARSREVAAMLLGGGSNLCVSDRGLDRFVIRYRAAEVTLGEVGDAVLVSADAGERWDQLVALSVEHGLAGLECLSGIPGNVGATPIQNVGAYGQEVSDSLEYVEAIDLETLSPRIFTAGELELGYRDSILKRALRGRFAITKVGFRLRRGAPAAPRYAELARAMEDRPITVGALRETVLALRRSKSMVLDPADENRMSAGSFFMNPVVSSEARDRVRAWARARGLESPSYPAPGGRYKLAAGWLIEQAGNAKGTRHGGAAISTKHALCLVNRGGATARDILELARRVQASVEATFGVTIYPEPELLGFDGSELGPLGSRPTSA